MNLIVKIQINQNKQEYLDIKMIKQLKNIIEDMLLGKNKKPNKFHPGMKCNCRDCFLITDLMGK